ncbi:MAG: TonB-dependent receptor plug domain-containing protein [Bacteroidia bacterium]
MNQSFAQQTEVDSLAQYDELETVVITAQHAPTTANRSIYQVRVLDQQRIQAQAAQNLNDLLQSELGVQLNQDPALGTQIQLQGLSGQNVKILIDGVPVMGRLDGQIDLSQLPLSQVARIEIIEGPMSVEYGTNALGGVINLITKQGIKQSWEAQVSAYEANIGPGWSIYEGIHNQDASFRLRRGKHQFGLSGGRQFFGGSFAERFQRSSTWNPKAQAFGTADYRYQGAKGSLSLQSQYFDEYLIRASAPSGVYEIRARDEHFQTTRLQQQLRYEYRFKNDFRWQGILAYSRFNRQRNVYNVDLIKLNSELLSQAGSVENFAAWNARGSFQKDIVPNKWSAKLGYDLNRESTQGDKILSSQQAMLDVAAFASVEYQPHQAWTIRPGLRATYNDLYPAPLTPSLHLRFAPNQHWQWRASYARGFRAPSLKELYLDFVDINHNLTGNPQLKAEYGHYFQFSSQWQKVLQKSLIRLSAQSFYNQVQDQIALTLIDNSDNAYTYFNLSDVSLSGLRTTALYRQEKWSLQLGYNLLGRTTPATNWVWSSQLNANLQLQLPAAIKLNLFYKYNGPVQTLRNVGDTEQPELILSTLAGYHWGDMSLQRTCFAERLDLSFGIKNIFNVNTVAASGSQDGAHSGGEGQSNIATGRSFFLRLQFRLKGK